MKYKSIKMISGALFSVFALGFTAASAMEPFSSHLAVPVSKFIKEQIYDHRLTPHDVIDIKTVSTEMNCQPIIAEINKSDCKIDITLRWISNRWSLPLPPEPKNTYFGSEAFIEMTQYMARETETRTYKLERKDKEWADACRDFDKMFREYHMCYMADFECQDKAIQDMVINYFQTTGNTTDDAAMARDLFEMDDATIAAAKTYDPLTAEI